MECWLSELIREERPVAMDRWLSELIREERPVAMDRWLSELICEERLPDAFADTVATAHRPIARRIAEIAASRRRTTVVGLCGPQGSGKSVMAKSLGSLLGEQGLRAVALSLDDLYLTRRERERLAAVHPLFITRGVPGTHDVELGLSTLDRLARPGEVRVPRFDKAADDRQPPEAWDRVQGPVDVVIFEGWCVGAVPQPDAALQTPVNDLEREADPDGRWRRHVNAALAGPYQRLFERLDQLVVLVPPGFEVVAGWRTEQERKMRRSLADQGQPPRGMTDEAIARFVAHYERLTRHILSEMPGRADVTVDLDSDRRPIAVRMRRRR